MCASPYHRERKKNPKKSEEDSNKDSDYMISDIIQGATHIYEKKEEKSKKICTGDEVKTSNLKDPPDELSEMKHKLCGECIDEAGI